MAQKSRKARYMAQLKRENTLLRRHAMDLQKGLIKANGLVVMALMNEGGDITFTRETLDRLGLEGPALGYELKAHENGALTVVMAVTDAALLEEIHAAAATADKAAAQLQESLSANQGIVLTDGQ